MLLTLGADLNAMDGNGETAMHAAAHKNLPKVVKLLAAKGAGIDSWNRPNRFGWTPLAIAGRLPVRQLQAVTRDRGRRA